MSFPLSSSTRTAARPRAAAGFTLIELLIACLIMLVMLGVVVYLFNQVQSGTNMSLARAQLSVTGRAVDARLRADFTGVIGPNAKTGQAAGCLVIIPAIRQGYLPLANGQMTRHKVRLRSDQLVFMTKMDAASWLNPTAPGLPWTSMDLPDQNQATSRVQSNEARIWIGGLYDPSLPSGTDNTNDVASYAHLWQVGRDCKLLGRLTGSPQVPDPAYATPLGDLTVQSNTDLATGSLALLADKACGVQTLPGGATCRGISWRNDALLGGGQTGSDWDDITGYVQKLAVKPNDPLDYTNQPAATTNVDLHVLYRAKPNPTSAVTPQGVDLSDLQNTHLRMMDNCSEIVVQWAGDLDKDGEIDTYPKGHPLAGSIIWYPEEYHATAQKTAIASSRYASDILAKYNQIVANPWVNTFVAGGASGFRAKGPAVLRFGGHGDQSANWYKGFQFDYGETDGSGTPKGQAVAAPQVPAPYVFRFEDDQYRLVHYGFRQDGSVYKNAHDTKEWPPNTVAANRRHAFPCPPVLDITNPNPSMATLYAGIGAPAGPYPRVGTAALATAGTVNFADNMGSQWIYPGLPAFYGTAPFGTGPFRTNPSAAHPTGLILNSSAASWQQVYQCGPSPNGNYLMLAVQVTGTDANGTEEILSPSTPYRSEPMDGYPQGRRLSIVPSDEPGFALGTMDATDFTNTTQKWFAVKLGAAASGTEKQINVSGYNYMQTKRGPGNNYTASYRDLWDEYLKPIQTPALVGTRDDWRNPQSDWPRLLRVRLRLHDRTGRVVSYSDEAGLNGRDDDGDGVVDNPEETRISGLWFEYILAVPYPRDPNPGVIGD